MMFSGRVMKKHNGMKSQDIIILLYICQYCDGSYKVMDISNALQISQSEISESIHRSRFARLIGQDKYVARKSLTEFLIFGLRYVFPVVPGAMVKGVPTSHSAAPLRDIIASGNDHFVWKHRSGSLRGMEVEPLYKTVPVFCNELPELYELLTLVDALRIGQVREMNAAKDMLEIKILKKDSENV